MITNLELLVVCAADCNRFVSNLGFGSFQSLPPTGAVCGQETVSNAKNPEEPD